MATVLILGGGFGGLAAAHELRRVAPDDEVVVVDASDRFFMGFAKLWDLAGVRPLADGSRSLRDIERHGIRYVQATVEGIDADARRVTTSAGDLDGDALLVALGAGPSPSHRAMLDAAANAHDVYDATNLDAIRADLDRVTSGRVVVCVLGGPFKCPPGPYEVALIVDDRLRRRGVRDDVAVTVATFQPISLPAAGVDASRYVASFLDGAGVELMTGHQATAIDGDAKTVTFEGGSTLDYSVLLGVPSNVPPPAVADSSLAGDGGWIKPDRYTFRTGVDGVYAVGDCTLVPNGAGALPKAGVFAASEGIVAARNIARDLGRLDAEEARFDGHGYCFLELPGRKVAVVEGDFYAEPKPDVQLSDADEARFAQKQAYEQERLTAWFG